MSKYGVFSGPYFLAFGLNTERFSPNEGYFSRSDGASNMFGKNTGVSVKIAAEQPKALSTDCQGHSLNLGIKAILTNSKQMKR